MSDLVSPLLKPAPKARKAPKPIVRGKRPARVRKTASGREKESLNRLFSQVIRLRDPWCRIGRCRYIKGANGAAPTSDAAHLFAKSIYPTLRWNLLNAVGACRYCHDAMTAKPATWVEWRDGFLTESEARTLHALANVSPDRAEVRAALTAQLRRIAA